MNDVYDQSQPGEQAAPAPERRTYEALTTRERVDLLLDGFRRTLSDGNMVALQNWLDVLSPATDASVTERILYHTAQRIGQLHPYFFTRSEADQRRGVIGALLGGWERMLLEGSVTAQGRPLPRDETPGVMIRDGLHRDYVDDPMIPGGEVYGYEASKIGRGARLADAYETVYRLQRHVPGEPPHELYFGYGGEGLVPLNAAQVEQFKAPDEHVVVWKSITAEGSH